MAIRYRATKKFSPLERGKKMKHSLKISVSKKSQMDGIVSFRNITVREKLLRFLLGSKQRVMVLVPGDSVEELSICEIKEGGQS